MPLQFADNCFRIRVKQQLVWIKAVSVIRFIRTVDTVAIDRARPGIRQEAVPDLVCVFRKVDALDLCRAIIVEETQLDLGGIRGENSKIYSEASPRRTERERQSFSNSRGL